MNARDHAKVSERLAEQAQAAFDNRVDTAGVEELRAMAQAHAQVAIALSLAELADRSLAQELVL